MIQEGGEHEVTLTQITYFEINLGVPACGVLFLLAADAGRPTSPLLSRSSVDAAYGVRAAGAFQTVYRHAGNFRYLDAITDQDLLTFVQGLTHPNSGGYGKLSSTRTTNFNSFLDSLFTAIADSLADGSTGDWCGVKMKASAAGYAVRRFYDTGTGRRLVYGYDTTSYGQSYFFINPFAKRNIVIEVPHEDLEYGTKVEGVRLFRALAARALIINKEHRCSDPDTSACATNQSTSVCGGRLRESDVAHHTANTFYLLHVRYTDTDSVTKFIQLHGMGGSSSDMVEVGDGSTSDYNTGSISVSFAESLDQYVPTPWTLVRSTRAIRRPPSAARPTWRGGTRTATTLARARPGRALTAAASCTSSRRACCVTTTAATAGTGAASGTRCSQSGQTAT